MFKAESKSFYAAAEYLVHTRLKEEIKKDSSLEEKIAKIVTAIWAHLIV
ncbi:MAG: hypothetical protein HY920_01785 [Elusimicrobia bacterium]|nr:hypothetical protein [Elusimicrobiota bacterium]